MDFRQQQLEVDKAIALFSGEDTGRAKEIWLVDPAPKVIERYQEAVKAMEKWMESKDIVAEPQHVYNIKGDAARVEFINRFKEVQRLKTQLDQYTDLNDEQKSKIQELMPDEQLRSFRSSYLEIAKQLKEVQQKEGDRAPDNVQQLEFEFVLFASAVVDYDYIMNGREQNTIHVFSPDGKNIAYKKLVMTNDDYPVNMSKHVRDPKIYKKDGRYSHARRYTG